MARTIRARELDGFIARATPHVTDSGYTIRVYRSNADIAGSGVVAGMVIRNEAGFAGRQWEAEPFGSQHETLNDALDAFCRDAAFRQKLSDHAAELTEQALHGRDQNGEGYGWDATTEDAIDTFVYESTAAAEPWNDADGAARVASAAAAVTEREEPTMTRKMRTASQMLDSLGTEAGVLGVLDEITSAAEKQKLIEETDAILRKAGREDLTITPKPTRKRTPKERATSAPVESESLGPVVNPDGTPTETTLQFFNPTGTARLVAAEVPIPISMDVQGVADQLAEDAVTASEAGDADKAKQLAGEALAVAMIAAKAAPKATPKAKAVAKSTSKTKRVAPTIPQPAAKTPKAAPKAAPKNPPLKLGTEPIDIDGVKQYPVLRRDGTLTTSQTDNKTWFCPVCIVRRRTANCVGVKGATHKSILAPAGYMRAERIVK